MRFSYLPTLRLLLKLQPPPEQTLQLLRKTRLALPIVQQAATGRLLPTLQMAPDLRIRQQIRLLQLQTKPATGQLLPTLQTPPDLRIQQQIQLLHLKTKPATGQFLPTLQTAPGL